MVHTIDKIADHLGNSYPRVVGSEYVVDASIDISSYVASGEVITAASLGLTQITAVCITGLSEDAMSGGYGISMVVAETDDEGNYSSDASSFQLRILAASGTDPSGANLLGTRVRVWGVI